MINVGQRANHVSLGERLDIIDPKSRIGDWKGDTIVKGRKNTFVMMVERKALFTVVKRIESKHADITADALTSSIESLQSHILTITLGNGKEFAPHDKIGEKLNADFFCTPLFLGTWYQREY